MNDLYWGSTNDTMNVGYLDQKSGPEEMLYTSRRACVKVKYPCFHGNRRLEMSGLGIME